jgi:hypothetical protein
MNWPYKYGDTGAEVLAASMVAVIRFPEAPGSCATASVGASASQTNTQQFLKLNN